MSLIVGTTTNNKTRTLIPEGTHYARCISVVDMGTADAEWQGQVKKRKTVRFTFEFPKHTAVFREEDGPQPLGRSVKYTNGFSQKGRLRPELEKWRGKSFTADELLSFDLASVLGHPCLATIVHVQGRDGQTVDRISGLSSVPEDMPSTPAVNELFTYDVDEHPKNFDRVPAWMREEILACDELAHLNGNSETKPEVATNEVPF
tara:strand:+ start:2843 stop:3454 length:612 start_codon:yes stop_codon:yes gene_type:complete